MSELPDPNALRRALERVDRLKEQLRVERIKAGNLAARLRKAQRLAAAARPEPEQRAG